MRSENMPNIALNAVRLPKFEPVNGESWSPRTLVVKDLRQRRTLTWFCACAERCVIFSTRPYAAWLITQPHSKRGTTAPSLLRPWLLWPRSPISALFYKFSEATTIITGQVYSPNLSNLQYLSFSIPPLHWWRWNLAWKSWQSTLPHQMLWFLIV